MSFQHRKTPGDQSRGIRENHHSHDESTISSIAHCDDQSDIFRQQLQGIYVVIASIQTASGEQRFRRRFYAQLSSAQLAVDRARMNGRIAYLFIGRVHIVDGDA